MALYEQSSPRIIWRKSSLRARAMATLVLDARGNLQGKWGSEYLGAMLIIGDLREYYMIPVKTHGIDNWLDDSMHPINQAETVNLLVALSTWSNELRGALINVWVDSAVAKGCISNGYSPSKVLTRMTGEIWLTAERLHAGLWIHYVNTKMNPADDLSRGDDEMAKQSGFVRRQRTTCPSPIHWRL